MASVNNLGLRNSLFSIINKNEIGSTEYSIAYYLLKNFSNFDSLNIYEMVDECNVSRSSINRFVKSLGYDNFLDFKRGFKIKKYVEEKKNLMTRPYPDYINLLTKEIFEMMSELRRRMDTEEVVNICKKIHDSNRVVFLSSSSNTGMVQYFQQEFILMDKLIYSISESYSTDSLLDELVENDYVLTFSNSGRFAEATLDLVKDLSCEKNLITLNRDKRFNDYYGKIYYLSGNNVDEVDINIYNRYGITYMLDIILNTYSSTYFSDNKGEKNEV